MEMMVGAGVVVAKGEGDRVEGQAVGAEAVCRTVTQEVGDAVGTGEVGEGEEVALIVPVPNIT